MAVGDAKIPLDARAVAMAIRERVRTAAMITVARATYLQVQ